MNGEREVADHGQSDRDCVTAIETTPPAARTSKPGCDSVAAHAFSPPPAGATSLIVSPLPANGARQPTTPPPADARYWPFAHWSVTRSRKTIGSLPPTFAMRNISEA